MANRTKKLVRAVRVIALTRGGERTRSKTDPGARKRIAAKIKKQRLSAEGRRQLRLGIKTLR